MKTQLKELKREQDQLITDMFSLSLTYERARLSKTRRTAKSKAKIVKRKLQDNERNIQHVN